MVPTVPSTTAPTTVSPTLEPTQIQSSPAPSQAPTTVGPTTIAPSLQPTTVAPSTLAPSIALTPSPSIAPFQHADTAIPTIQVTQVLPTLSPTHSPNAIPTFVPTLIPSLTPTRIPSVVSTLAPSTELSSSPSFPPSQSPSKPPSVAPSQSPSQSPTVSPSTRPSFKPSAELTVSPTSPTVMPSEVPTAEPTVSGGTATVVQVDFTREQFYSLTVIGILSFFLNGLFLGILIYFCASRCYQTLDQHMSGGGSGAGGPNERGRVTNGSRVNPFGSHNKGTKGDHAILSTQDPDEEEGWYNDGVGSSSNRHGGVVRGGGNSGRGEKRSIEGTPGSMNSPLHSDPARSRSSNRGSGGAAPQEVEMATRNNFNAPPLSSLSSSSPTRSNNNQGNFVGAASIPHRLPGPPGSSVSSSSFAATAPPLSVPPPATLQQEPVLLHFHDHEEVFDPFGHNNNNPSHPQQTHGSPTTAAATAFPAFGAPQPPLPHARHSPLFGFPFTAPPPPPPSQPSSSTTHHQPHDDEGDFPSFI